MCNTPNQIQPQTQPRTQTQCRTVTAPDPNTTARLAARLGRALVGGDVILLHGPVGAGKSHFARALIQARLADLGRYEDVPSPTFTLVQIYDLGGIDLWHADLYRLTDPHECLELGLDHAFESAICLIEWPDRLGEYAPKTAVSLHIRPGDQEDTRHLEFCASTERGHDILTALCDGDVT